jgi:outer membrane protein OmpA-like peptidoglycan-associated protein
VIPSMAVPTLRPTREDLRSGLTLPTGAKYTIILPPLVVRVRMVGILFETDKTFVLPSALPGIRRLKTIYDAHVGKTVLVSGHTDRAGTTEHNLALSVERAKAVAAFLRDDDADWSPRYQAGTQVSAQWGTREDQHMLSVVADSDGDAYFSGVVTGRNDAATRAAVKQFRADNNLPDRAMDADARRLLIQGYMATDGTTLPAGTTLVVHGCGESHPSVATRDSVALAENRRVELFFFRGPVKPPPVDPCPSGGCAEYPQWLDETVQTIDVNSDPEVVVFIVDELGLPLRNAPVRLVMPDGTTEDVSTDGAGKIRPRVAPGTSFDIIVSDVHEGGPQDSLQTPSGHHFAAGGDEPAGEDGP